MSFSRQFAGLALLAVFSVVSVLGDGLHLISGCNHYHAPAHCCADHGHCHAQAADRHGESGEVEVGASDAGCPICQFLAIPRALTAPPVIVSCGFRFGPLVVVAPLQLSLEVERPYGARAPPVSPNA
jgi:hypothetical protein